MDNSDVIPTIGFGMVGGCPVFLDVAEDAYFRLPPAEESAFQAHQNGEHGATLLADDLLAARECERSTLLTSVLDEPTCGATPAAVAWIWRAVGTARRDLAERPFATLLTELHTRLPDCARPDGEQAARAAARQFRAARSWVPAQPHCLVDSLAFMRWLARRQVGARLVLGVKLEPFAAHCWVEAGTLLLNDHLDQVQRFTPVFRLPE